MDIQPYLQLLAEKEGSDLFLTPGAQVKIKIEGIISSVGKTVLTGEMTREAAYGMMKPQQVETFARAWDVDFAIALPDGSTRFRVNVFKQRGEVAICLRRIPRRIPSIDQLGLPDVLKQLIHLRRGLILMVGATGSGKTTTLASMIKHRNERSPGHILTIEDPIEYYHPNIKCIVNQREIGVDAKSYRHALHSAMREAPDIVLIGEVRDQVTIGAALELCNTGHLCLATMHANNASQAIERVINLFPRELHRQLSMDLSMNIRAVISQRLVLSVEGKNCAAVEVMVNTPHVADLIMRGEVDRLKEAIENSGAKGMQSFDMALHTLLKDGKIDLAEALDHSDSRVNLEAKINFG
jgi:twitching motility protein PilU